MDRKPTFSVGKCLNPICGAATLNQYIHYCDRWACQLLRGLLVTCEALGNDKESLEAAYYADLANNADTADEDEEIMYHAASSSKKRPLDESRFAAKAEPVVKALPTTAAAASLPPHLPDDAEYQIPKKKRDVIHDNLPIPKRKREDIPRRPDLPHRRPDSTSTSDRRPTRFDVAPPQTLPPAQTTSAPSNPFAAAAPPQPERRGSNNRFVHGYVNHATITKSAEAAKKDIIYQPNDPSRQRQKGDKAIHKKPAAAHHNPTPFASGKPRRVSFHSEWIQPASKNLRRVHDPVSILKVPTAATADTTRPSSKAAASSYDRSDSRNPERPAKHSHNSAAKNQKISVTEYKQKARPSTQDHDDETSKSVKAPPTDPRRAMKLMASRAADPPNPHHEPPLVPTSANDPARPEGHQQPTKPTLPPPPPPRDPRQQHLRPPPPPPPSSSTPPAVSNPVVPKGGPPNDPRARPPVVAAAIPPNDHKVTGGGDGGDSSRRPTSPEAATTHPTGMSSENVDDEDNSWMMEAPSSKYANPRPVMSSGGDADDDADVHMSGPLEEGEHDDNAGNDPEHHEHVHHPPPFHPLEGEYIDEVYESEAPSHDDQPQPLVPPVQLDTSALYDAVWLLSGRVHSALMSMKLPLTKKADNYDHFQSVVRDVEAIDDAPVRMTFRIEDRPRGHDNHTEVTVKVGTHVLMHYLDKGSRYTALHAVLPRLYTQAWVWHMLVNNIQEGLYPSLDQALHKSRYYEVLCCDDDDEGSGVAPDGSVYYFKCIFRLQVGYGVHEHDVAVAKTRCYDRAWEALQAICARLSYMYRPLVEEDEDDNTPASAEADGAALTSSLSNMHVDEREDLIALPPHFTNDLAPHLALLERDPNSPGSSPVFAHPTVPGRLPDQFSDDDEDMYA
ncbi:hypothetical protein DYB36_012039 [Aphanomyces astaci]|uniref:Uncharacterized protein n=1 Tax=Aphanomyces astaci TaxID=112090 RepID=A0A397AW37_APHAT|nr:hypothetical protein DYB36_012039 [Aphanomyces astaci]